LTDRFLAECHFDPRCLTCQKPASACDSCREAFAKPRKYNDLRDMTEEERHNYKLEYHRNYRKNNKQKIIAIKDRYMATHLEEHRRKSREYYHNKKARAANTSQIK
jgi:hypothetical protein